MQPQRTILQGVPRIGFDVHHCPFPGSLYAVLKYVGDPCDYDYLMGITGACFRRLWNRDDGGNVDLSYFGDEPFRRAFDALGYEWIKVPAEKEAMFRAVVESINRGVPAISFGIIGPPEAGVVAGYDTDGEILYGWSYFQTEPWANAGVELEPSGYYRKRDWYEMMDKNAGKGLIILGAKRSTRPAARDVLAASLQWALDLERTARRSGLPDHVGGLAAYDAWAAALEVDVDYPPQDNRVMETRMMVYGDQCTMLYERSSAAKFLRQMAEAVPQNTVPLNTAAAIYEQVAAIVFKLWPWDYTDWSGLRQALSDPEARRALAGHVRAARALEAQAVEQLAQALAAH